MKAELIKALRQKTKSYSNQYRFILFFNLAAVGLFLALAVYAVLVEGGGAIISQLFEEPFVIERPYTGMLTKVSELLWSITGIICFLSYSFLKRLSPQRRSDPFLLYSAVGCGILLMDDAFRLTLMMSLFLGIPKLLMYVIYGTGAIAYGLAFWRRMLATPYGLLIIAAIFLVFSALTDVLHITGQGLPAMLEDGTKFIGILNIALYFWVVCHRRFQRSLNAFTAQQFTA